MTEDKIKGYYNNLHVPANIIAHMRAVASFAEDLCLKISNKGNKINKNLVVESALLHDCYRVCDIRNFEPDNFPQPILKEDLNYWQQLRNNFGEIGHEEAMAQHLLKDGFPAHSRLVKMHNFFLVDELETLEEKILYYADKRIEFDKLVSLEHRFEEGRKRNFSKEDSLNMVMKIEQKVYELEREIQALFD